MSIKTCLYILLYLRNLIEIHMKKQTFKPMSDAFKHFAGNNQHEYYDHGYHHFQWQRYFKRKEISRKEAETSLWSMLVYHIKYKKTSSKSYKKHLIFRYCFYKVTTVSSLLTLSSLLTCKQNDRILIINVVLQRIKFGICPDLPKTFFELLIPTNFDFHKNQRNFLTKCPNFVPSCNIKITMSSLLDSSVFTQNYRWPCPFGIFKHSPVYKLSILRFPLLKVRSFRFPFETFSCKNCPTYVQKLRYPYKL